VVVAMVVLALLSRLATSQQRPLGAGVAEHSARLLRGAAKWGVQAEQDSNPVFALMHVSYAQAYVQALRDLLTDQQIQSVHGVDPRELQRGVEATQTKVTQALNREAPFLLPPGQLLPYTGWLK